MKKKILIIVIENVNRELSSKLILSLRALKRNYRVIIGAKGILWNIIKYIDIGCVVLKSFGPRNDDFIKSIKKRGFKIISNDEELLLAYEVKERVNYRMNHENIYQLDNIISVGDFDHIEIQKQFPKMKDKVRKCGNIRVELLKKNYNHLLEEVSSKIKNKYGNFVLLTTSFGRINFEIKRKDRIDFIFHRVVNDKLDPFSKEVILEKFHLNTQRNVLLRFIKFIDNFEKNFKGKKLIISVKPGENLNFWKNYIKQRNFNNVYLRTDYNKSTTLNYILASDLVISSNSTSLMEAYKLNKITVNNLDTHEVPSEIEFLKKCSYVVRSYDELIEDLKDIFLGKKKYINVDNEIKKYIINSNEDYDGFESLLNVIDSHNLENHKIIYTKKYFKYYFQFINVIRIFKAELKIFFKKFYFKKNKLTVLDMLYEMKIGDRLKKKNFIKLINEINQEEKVSNLKIKQIVPDAFLLDSD